MGIRRFTIFAIVFFAIVGMSFVLSDAQTDSKADSASTPTDDAGATKGESAEAPAGEAAAATDGSPSEGPSSDGSSFKASIVGAFVNIGVASMFLF